MTTEQSASEVSVQLTDCAREDADAVLAALWAAFPRSADRASERGRTHEEPSDHPIVWCVTVDTDGTAGARGTQEVYGAGTAGGAGTARAAGTAGGGAAARTALARPVTADLSGGYRAVDRVREALAEFFRIEDEGSVSGDQEKELRLRLSAAAGPDGGPDGGREGGREGAAPGRRAAPDEGIRPRSDARPREGGPEAVPVLPGRLATLDGIVWEPSERWVRATKGPAIVIDSRRPVLVWESGRPVPLYAFPQQDVRMDLLRKAAAPPPGHHPTRAAYYDAEFDGQTVHHAAWTYPGEALAGYISFDWFGREVLDHWYEEETEIFVHPRDPYSRVDALPSSRHIRVEIGGATVADTRTPVLLFETGLPVRYYLPREDVRFDLLVPSEQRTRCPYKGLAEEYWSWAGGELPPNVAWSYPDPLLSVAAIAGRVAFYNEVVDIICDGELLPRPATHFIQRTTP